MSGRSVSGLWDRLLDRLLRRRLEPRQRSRLLGELDELYEHRVRSRGPHEAARWLRRERRRLFLRLVLGARIVGPGSRTVIAPRGHGPSDLLSDVRLAVRSLARAPLFTGAVMLTVGLGIGGATLVYAVVHAVLVAPLPYPGAQRMVLLRTIRGSDAWGTSMADLDALYDAPPPAFEALAGYTRRTARVRLGTRVALLPTKAVTDNYFTMLGTMPTAGRAFLPAEGRPGGGDAVLVTETFWREALGAPALSGEPTLTIDGKPRALVGVLPDRLGPLDRGIDVFPVLPVETPQRKGPFFFVTVGRLRADADPAVATEQLAQVSRAIFPAWRDSFSQEDAVLGFVDLKDMLVGDVAGTLLTVLTAVGLLLVIAAANASSLLVARGLGRRRDMAIRAALGASAGRILRLLLTESALLAMGGAVIGFTLASAGVDVVARMGEGRLPRAEEITLHPPALLLFAAAAGSCWVLFGTVGAASGLGRRGAWLGQVRGRAGTGLRSRRLRRGLVSAQFAVTVPLLVVAGLLLKSLDRIRSESFGFDPEGVGSMLVSLPPESYPDQASVRGFWEEVLPRLRALPGVRAAGVADARPPLPTQELNNFVLEDRPLLPGEPVLMAPWITADPGFFDVLGITPVAGTFFRDPLTDTTQTVVVDRAWADRYYPGTSAVGRRFRSGACTRDGCPWMEVVGVVPSLKTAGLDDTRGLGTVYYDFRRSSYPTMRLYFRAAGKPGDVLPLLQRVLAERDPGVPVAEMSTVEQTASEALRGRRYTSLLLSVMAAVALLLSVVGVYGAMAHFVRRHRREIGIRLALGEAPGRALLRVVGLGTAVAGAGTAVGLAASLVIARRLSALLYRVSSWDPLIYISIAGLTLAVAVVASAIPGRSAAGADPAGTLREE